MLNVLLVGVFAAFCLSLCIDRDESLFVRLFFFSSIQKSYKKELKWLGGMKCTMHHKSLHPPFKLKMNSVVDFYLSTNCFCRFRSTIRIYSFWWTPTPRSAEKNCIVQNSKALRLRNNVACSKIINYISRICSTK